MKRWQLWQGEGGHTFLAEDNEPACVVKETAEVLVGEVPAQGWNPAHRLLYEHPGWGDYKPLLRGTADPEDEDVEYGGPTG